MAHHALIVFVFALLQLLLTVSPTVSAYHLDSAEFVIGAATLGIVHAPGYPLYLLIAHLFTYLPLGELPLRVNLLSALALAGSAPLLFLTLHHLIRDRLLAAGVTLVTLGTFHVWQTGVAAEIYAPQMFTLTLTAYALTSPGLSPRRRCYVVAAGYGLALAITPASVLFAPGVALVTLYHRPAPRDVLLAVLLALVIIVLPLVYFPLRMDAAYSAAGYYDSAGVFQRVNLRTVAGVWWHLRGAAFADLYFAGGVIPSWGALRELLVVFGSNFLWVGAAVMLVGWLAMIERARRVLTAWAVLFAPFVYFYATYGAADKLTMLAPGHVLLAVPLAYGLRALLAGVGGRWRLFVVALAVVTVVGINGAVMWSQRDDPTLEQAAHTLANLPPDAVVFGRWGDVVPLQYLHIVGGQRPDVRLVNLFFFPPDHFAAYMRTPPAPPVVFLHAGGDDTPLDHFIADNLPLTPLPGTGAYLLNPDFTLPDGNPRIR